VAASPNRPSPGSSAFPAPAWPAPQRRRLAKDAAPLSPATGEVTGSRPSPLYSVRFGEVWNFVRRQPASFILVCFYLFMEYVRPQQIWTVIAGPPYSKFIIGLAIVAFFLEGRKIRLGMPEFWLGLFTLIVLASSVMSLWPDDSYADLSIYLSWVVIYVLIANSNDTEERFLVFALSFILYSFKMAQHGTRSWAADGFAFRNWGANGAPGWFSNSGEFAIQMCVFLAIVVCFTRSLAKYWPKWKRYLFWSMPVCAVISIVASSSRGGLVGLGAVALWLLLKSRYKVRALIGTAVLAVSVYFLLPEAQIQRLQNMGDDVTSVSRTDLWNHGLKIMSEYPVLGIGYKNWLTYHELHYGLRLLPHNIFIEAGSELGFVGLLTFVVLIGVTLLVNHRTRKLMKGRGEEGRFIFEMSHGLDAALIGYLACGFFVTVLYYPFFWINLAMTVSLHNAALNKLQRSGSSVPLQSRGRGRTPQVGSGRARRIYA